MTLRDHFPPRDDNRATELDPSTFDHPEQFQPSDRLVTWTWRALLLYWVGGTALLLWALWTLFKAAFG